MKTLSRIVLVLALAAGIALAVVYREHLDAAALTAWVTSAGAAGPLVFMAVYAVATVLFLPGSLLTLVGGALFGPVWGTFYNLTGATLGAAMAFLIARYLAADWVQAKAGGAGQRLVQGVEAEGWRFVAFTRLVPLFPFNLLNFALGLTRIPFWHYSRSPPICCMLPGALAYTWLGYAGREAAGGGEGLIQKGLIALALLRGPRLPAAADRPPAPGAHDAGDRAQGQPGRGRAVAGARRAHGRRLRRRAGAHRRRPRTYPWRIYPSAWSTWARIPRRPIVLVCRTDRRSAKAAALLAQRGFTRAQVVQGGMTAWLDHGWPVERDPPPNRSNRP